MRAVKLLIRLPKLGRRLDRIGRQLQTIDGTLRLIEASSRRLTQEVRVSQEKIDQLEQQVAAATEGIRQDIAELKAEAPQLDFSKLEARVEQLAGLDAENPAPAPGGEGGVTGF